MRRLRLRINLPEVVKPESNKPVLLVDALPVFMPASNQYGFFFGVFLISKRQRISIVLFLYR